MKKLKIFLLLSILLCFGFALSSEVHAQGNGPKVFEVNDILPATTQLRISWVDYLYNLQNNASITTNNGSFKLIYTSGSDSNVYIKDTTGSGLVLKFII